MQPVTNIHAGIQTLFSVPGIVAVWARQSPLHWPEEIEENPGKYHVAIAVKAGENESTRVANTCKRNLEKKSSK